MQNQSFDVTPSRVESISLTCYTEKHKKYLLVIPANLPDGRQEPESKNEKLFCVLTHVGSSEEGSSFSSQ